MSITQGAVGEELTAAGFSPVASKLFAPKPGLVSRTRLVDRVRASGGDLVLAVAPAGYGKSSFLAELARVDDRPVAWVTLSSGDDDPASLLAYVAMALDGIKAVDGRYVSSSWSRSSTAGTSAHHAFEVMLSERQRSFTLVLDDVHVLRRRESLDTLAALVAHMPAGSRLALASREAIAVPLGRLRTSRQVVEIGPRDLAFDEPEIFEVLDVLGVTADSADVERLLERTEGWPVAVYLAALSHGPRCGVSCTPIAAFDGEHRFLVEYLSEELLGATDGEMVSFLLEASCFDRMSGAMCDDVLDRSGSAQLLEAAQRRNLLVLPLDDRREWYRFHHLMTEFLQNELARRDVTRQREIHRRASDWFHARGDADGAITHAVRSGDLDRAESLVLPWFGHLAMAGRNQAMDGWLSLFDPEALDAHPGLMISAANARFTDGDPVGAMRWLNRTAGVVDHHPPEARGPEAPVMLALSRAVITPLTPAEMADESRYAYVRIGTGVGHSLSCLALGAAEFLLGDQPAALARFTEGAATTLQEPTSAATCLAHIAVVHVLRNDWGQASVSARQGRALVGEHPGPTAALVLAMSVLVETHAGRSRYAEADRVLCRQHLTGLLGVAPWLNLQARIALAQAAALVGNQAELTALVAEAEHLAGELVDPLIVRRQLAGLRTAHRSQAAAFGPPSLTTAELRVLQFMPTHLTNAEIAKRLYVSPYTVKSQMISIYRKLGTKSRGGAVELATTAGLIEPITT